MNSPKNPNLRNHLLAISASLLIGAGLMAVKFIAFYLTDSAAILSDALESIINVVAAGFAIGSIIIAAKRPDSTHPYGHGKVEYFSAGFEGALIILAALGIFYEAWPRLLHPQAIPRLEKGTLLILSAALVNLLLGLVLVMVGRRTKSIVLIADGKHVLTDVVTTVGVVLGLVGRLFHRLELAGRRRRHPGGPQYPRHRGPAGPPGRRRPHGQIRPRASGRNLPGHRR